ncbi:MAG: leucine-rich repeat domain-containing protein, partial [Vicinamibacterales bacterium]
MQEKSVNLWRQNLGVLPATLWENTALETLMLADNQLTELPPAIAALTSLRTLDLGHNLLTELPESLSLLTALTDYLYLHDNKLTALRESLFVRMIRLRYLN